MLKSLRFVQSEETEEMMKEAAEVRKIAFS